MQKLDPKIRAELQAELQKSKTVPVRSAIGHEPCTNGRPDREFLLTYEHLFTC
jgi:hypothetical protein